MLGSLSRRMSRRVRASNSRSPRCVATVSPGTRPRRSRLSWMARTAVLRGRPGKAHRTACPPSLPRGAPPHPFASRHTAPRPGDVAAASSPTRGSTARRTAAQRRCTSTRARASQPARSAAIAAGSPDHRASAGPAHLDPAEAHLGPLRRWIARAPALISTPRLAPPRALTPARDGAGSPDPSSRTRPACGRAAWKEIVDGSWITGRRARNLVDRTPCGRRGPTGIIRSARRGRDERTAEPPQGGRASRKGSRVLRQEDRPFRKEGVAGRRSHRSRKAPGPLARAGRASQGAHSHSQGWRVPRKGGAAIGSAVSSGACMPGASPVRPPGRM